MGNEMAVTGNIWKEMSLSKRTAYLTDAFRLNLKLSSIEF
jgi:hypothetical protein